MGGKEDFHLGKQQQQQTEKNNYILIISTQL